MDFESILMLLAFIGILLVIIGGPIIAIIFSLRSKAKTKRFLEENPNAAKLREDTPKTGKIFYEGITSEDGYPVDSSFYFYKMKGGKRKGHLLKPGKYTIKTYYQEVITGISGTTTKNYGDVTLVLNFEANKEYVLKVDKDTKQYSFEEYIG